MGWFATLKRTGSDIWGAKHGVQKAGLGLLFLFKKRRGSLTSSILACKLQTNKIWPSP
jgi:hypothetical protein